MRDGEPFALMIGALSPLGGRVFRPLRELDLESTTYDQLVFGYAIGLLDRVSLVEVETERLRLGLPQDERQTALAYASLSPEDLVGWAPTPEEERRAFMDATARRAWLIVVLRLFLEADAVDVPEIGALTAVWGTEGQAAWDAVRPRGWDAVFPGKGARARMSARIDAFTGSPHGPASAAVWAISRAGRGTR
jgi:hypothetical protein